MGIGRESGANLAGRALRVVLSAVLVVGLVPAASLGVLHDSAWAAEGQQAQSADSSNGSQRAAAGEGAAAAGSSDAPASDGENSPGGGSLNSPSFDGGGSAAGSASTAPFGSAAVSGSDSPDDPSPEASGSDSSSPGATANANGAIADGGCVSADVPIALAAEAAQGATLVQGGAVFRVAGGEATLIGWDDQAEGSVTVPGAISCNGGLAKVTAIDVPAPTDEEREAEAAMDAEQLAAAQAAKPQVKYVTLPASVASVGEAGLGDLPALRSVQVSSANRHYASHDGMLFAIQAAAGEGEADAAGAADQDAVLDEAAASPAAAEGWRLLYVPQAKAGAANIPAAAAQVSGAVLSAAAGITSITAESGSETFASRSGLLYSKNMRTLVAAPGGAAAVVIASECETIAEGAFANCAKLRYVAASGAVSQIADGAFSDEAKATACVMVRGGEGGQAAEAWKAAGFASFMELGGPGEGGAGEGGPGEGGASEGEGEADGGDEGGEPADDAAAAPGLAYDLQEDYTLAARWQGEPSECPESLEVPASAHFGDAEYPVAAVADGAFEGCDNLKSITLPASVERVGASAFEGTSLKSITLPAVLQGVGGRAFAGCDGLSVAALGSVPEVAEDALDGCSGVQVYVPYSESGEYAWSPALGLPAAGNRVLPYGVMLAEQPISLVAGESAALYAEGEALAPGDATVQVSYSVQCVSVDPEANQVTAKAEGSSDVTVAVLLDEEPLATGTRTVEVSAPAAEDGEGFPAAVSDDETDTPSIMSVDVPLSTQIRLSDDGTTQAGWGTFKSRNGNAVKVVAVSSDVQDGAASLFGDGAPEASLKLMKGKSDDGILAEVSLGESTGDPQYFEEGASFFIPGESQADMLYDLGSTAAAAGSEPDAEFSVANLSYTVAPVEEGEEAPETHKVTVVVSDNDDGSCTVLQGDGSALPEGGAVSVQDGYSKTFVVDLGEGRELNSSAITCTNESGDSVEWQLAGDSITLPSVTEDCTLAIAFDRTPYLVRWMDGDSILYQEVAYHGSFLSAPDLDASNDIEDYYSWFKDSAFDEPWNFGVAMVEGDTILYGKIEKDPVLITGESLNSLMAGDDASGVQKVIFGPYSDLSQDYDLDVYGEDSYEKVDAKRAGDIRMFRTGEKGSQTVIVACMGEKMYMNPDSSFMFNDFAGLQEIQGFDKESVVDSSRVIDMRGVFRQASQIVNLDLSGWDTREVRSMASMFFKAKALQNLTLGEHWDTSNVTSMSAMFRYDESLTSLDVCNWNVSNVEDMTEMFGSTSLVALDAGSWNTSNVEKMNGMFDCCTELTNLNAFNWDTSKVESMRYMFNYCFVLETLDVSRWDTTNVNDMSYMFYCCRKLTDLNVKSWTTSGVEHIKDMFYECKLLSSLDLSNWDTSYVEDMRYMFYKCESLETLVFGEGWDTSNVKYMQYMFCGCSRLDSLDVGNWDVSKVENMDTMFSSCSGLQLLDVGKWKTSEVTNMHQMFSGCSSLTTLDVSEWVTSKVKNMGNMFWICSSLSELKTDNWNTSNVTSMADMFYNCSSLNSLNVSKWNTSKVRDMDDMFRGCTSLSSLDVIRWDTSGVTSMDRMFHGCYALTFLDVGDWDVSKVTSMYQMFYSCRKLQSPDVSTWNTSEVTTMYQMFYSCVSPTFASLDLSGWDTAKVKDMGRMFGGCSYLKTVYVGSGWSVDGVSSSTSMFTGCKKLVNEWGYGPYATKKPPYSATSELYDKTFAHAATSADDPYGYFTLKSTDTDSTLASSIPAASYLSERKVA